MKKTLLYIFTGAAILAALGSAGCSDPWSQRRIAYRQDRLAAQVQSFETREARGIRRNQEAVATLREWLERDAERWDKRSKTIGDYVW